MIDIKVLQLYLDGESLRVMGDILNVEPQALRRALIKEGLAIKTKDRLESFKAYEARGGITDPVMVEPRVHIENEGELDVIQRKLSVSERALIRTRSELNYYRATLRSDERKRSLQDAVEDIVSEAIHANQPHVLTVTKPTKNKVFKDHTSMVLLSDVHAEELVSRKNVGNLNEYNWDIMEQRVSKVFNTWVSNYRGEDTGVIFLLGDMISGIIHSTLEHTTKPTAEAVHDLAEFLTVQIIKASGVFKNIHIGMVSGNHERIQEKPSSTNKGFDFGYLFAQILKAKLSSTTNVNVDISTTGFTTFVIGNKVCLGHHGDMFRGPFSSVRTSKIQASCESVTGFKPDHIFEGHMHNFSHHNTPTGVSLVNASVIGPNEYGLTAGFSPVRPSQTLITFYPEGDVEHVNQVFLD